MWRLQLTCIAMTMTSGWLLLLLLLVVSSQSVGGQPTTDDDETCSRDEGLLCKQQIAVLQKQQELLEQHIENQRQQIQTLLDNQHKLFHILRFGKSPSSGNSTPTNLVYPHLFRCSTPG